MSDPGPGNEAGGGAFPFLRGRLGRRLLVVALLASTVVLAWRFTRSLPSVGFVEVRWTEDAPEWVGVSYRDATGTTVRWRREAVPKDASRFRDRYELAPGTYRLRIELKQGDRLRAVTRSVDLPAAEPLVLYVEEAGGP